MSVNNSLSQWYIIITLIAVIIGVGITFGIQSEKISTLEGPDD